MLWSRAELKAKAKTVLKVSYWKAFLGSLVIMLAVGSQGSSFNLNWGSKDNKIKNVEDHFASADFSFEKLMPLIIGVGIFVLLVILIVIAYRIFIGYALEVGGRRYFSRASQNDIDLNNLAFSFNKAIYKDIIKSMVWKDFLNFLWFLLFIIPGIVKAYAYCMVPYILADNPNIGYKRAVELSKKMTDRQKFKMWVLDLSFIGWFLLGILAFIVGFVFVLPYYNSTVAELYLVLRENALQNGLCRADELNLESIIAAE